MRMLILSLLFSSLAFAQQFTGNEKQVVQKELAALHSVCVQPMLLDNDLRLFFAVRQAVEKEFTAQGFQVVDCFVNRKADYDAEVLVMDYFLQTADTTYNFFIRGNQVDVVPSGGGTSSKIMLVIRSHRINKVIAGQEVPLTLLWIEGKRTFKDAVAHVSKATAKALKKEGK
jgi:hypothetical protein